MADNRNTLTDEILVLAETLGDIKARFERVESEFAIQSRPLEAALAALSAAMTGIKTLQHHVLDNSLSALSLKVEEQRKAIDDQINVIVGELKGADAQNDEKIALQTAELKQQFAEICANVQQLSSQFDAQIKRVELEAKEQITKFAAVTGPQGPAGASFNPKGNWQEGVFYQRLDVVSLLGTSYVSNVDNNASKPTKNSDKWTVLAARAGNVGGGGAGNFASLAGIAEVSQGGTGITQYAIGDILYANDTGSLARLPAGVNGQFLKTTGAGGAPEWETPTGGGDVVGPASATDNALVRFDGTSGTAIQNSNATLTDAGALTLASTINVTDTILGSSGPSVKSTLSARAPRQGLVYDGTTNSSATLTSAIGTSDFTVSVPFTVPASNPSGARGIFSIGNFGNGQTFCAYIGTNGALDIVLFGTTGGDYRASGVLGFVSANAGKTGLLTITRSSTTLTVYFNGVSQTLVAPTVGGVDPTWAGTLTSTSVRHGNMSTILYFYVGYVGDLDLYNRALSASEVVALYEAGAPSGADYNSASNTGVITGQNNTFNGGIGNWTSGGTGTVAAGTNVMNCTAGSNADNLAGYLTFVNAGYNPKGYYVRVTADITNNSGTVRIGVGRAVLTQIGSLAGNGTFDATAFIPATTDADSFWICGATSSQTFTVDNFQVFRLGLLLAPDAAQAGGGLVWYDTSGNAANITLPSSGVSWNVPSSSYWGGQLKLQSTTGTNGLRINNISSDTFGFFGGGNDGLPVFSSLNNATIGSATYGWLAYNSTATGDFELYRRNNSTTNAAALIVARSTGNLIVGGAAGSDGGQKLQVSGTGYISSTLTVGSGGTGNNNGIVIANGGSGSLGGPLFAAQINGTNVVRLGSETAILGSGTTTKGVLFVQSGAFDCYTNGTLALTLDSSQNATFAGKISATSSGTNIVQLNLPFTSRITLGEGATNNANPAITLYRTTGGNAQGTAIRLYQPDSAGNFLIQKGTTDAVYGTETYTTQLAISPTGDATFTGAIAINNTVNTVSPTSPNRTITMVIGGTTYYIHAKTTND